MGPFFAFLIGVPIYMGILYAFLRLICHFIKRIMKYNAELKWKYSQQERQDETGDNAD